MRRQDMRSGYKQQKNRIIDGFIMDAIIWYAGEVQRAAPAYDKPECGRSDKLTVWIYLTNPPSLYSPSTDRQARFSEFTFNVRVTSGIIIWEN